MSALTIQMFAHAAAEYPREACGFVIEQGGLQTVVRCENHADKPEESFRITAEEYRLASQQGEIVAVYHSHTNGNQAFTEVDRSACEAMKLRWYLVTWPEKTLAALDPSDKPLPYKGRAFVHGVVDCYSLIRDWYSRERGLELPDYEREEEWWNKGHDLYVQHFAEAGFRRLEDEEQLEVGDVLLMQMSSNTTNHGAIYLGDDQILHHLTGHLSCVTAYGGFWRKHTTLRVRYSGES